MTIHRHRFFLALFALLIVPLVAKKLIWLAQSKTTTGIFYMKIHGNALEQMRGTFSLIYFKLGKDTIWFEETGYLKVKEGQPVAVRYQKNNPSDALVNNFRTVWGATVIYGGLPVLVLLVLFLHPHIIPYNARLRLTRKKPYIVQVVDTSVSHTQQQDSFFT
jgi:hypothetical protein